MSRVFHVLELTQPPYHPTLAAPPLQHENVPIVGTLSAPFRVGDPTQPSYPIPTSKHEKHALYRVFFVFGGLPTPSLHPRHRAQVGTVFVLGLLPTPPCTRTREHAQMGTFLVFGCNPTGNRALVGTFSYWAARELTPNTKTRVFRVGGHFPSLSLHANSENPSIWMCFRCWSVFLDPNTQNLPHGCVLCV